MLFLAQIKSGEGIELIDTLLSADYICLKLISNTVHFQDFQRIQFL